VLPEGDKAHKPYDFYFNKCFECAGLVADAGGNLAQMSSQMKEEDSMEEFNPWNRDVNLLEEMLNSHDSVMREGKGDRKAASEARVSISARKAEVGASAKEEGQVNQQLKTESKQQQFEKLMDNSNNLKHKEINNHEWQNGDKFKDVLEIEIEGLWQLMMKQAIWRKLTAIGRMINQSMNLIDKKKKMEQKTAEVQQQQRNKALGQLQTKVWDPGGFSNNV